MSPTSLLIKNGTIVTENKVETKDILIIGEQIETIEEKINYNADTIVDAKECYIFPGGIDPHTHMELPVMGTISSDSFKSGTLAALFGGTTTIIDFANQLRGEHLIDALNNWHNKAKNNCYTDYSFHISVTDVQEETLEEIKKMVKDQGVSSFKTFMAYNTMKIGPWEMEALMGIVKQYGGKVLVHAEDGEMINDLIKNYSKNKNKQKVVNHPLCHPPETESLATKNAIKISEKKDCPLYIVHVSCKKAISEIVEAQKQKLPILGETCIQYLLLDESLYHHKKFIEAAKYVLSPPLRKQEDREALWTAIQNGTIEVVATDHCPFLLKQKQAGENDFTKIPNGIPGVEYRLELLFSEGVIKRGMSLNQFVKLTSYNAAKIFGLFPKKGTIQAKSDADLVIFDPNKKHVISSKTHHMNCDYSPYEGMNLIGKCRTVILRGKIAIDHENILINEGYGQYLYRTT